MVIEVDVEPFAAGRARLKGRNGDKLRADALPAGLRDHHRVQDESVDAAVPRHVHEADELVAVAGADPAQAVPLDLAFPVVFKHRMPKRLRMQCIHLRVVEVASPLVGHCHSASVTRDQPLARAERRTGSHQASSSEVPRPLREKPRRTGALRLSARRLIAPFDLGAYAGATSVRPAWTVLLVVRPLTGILARVELRLVGACRRRCRQRERARTTAMSFLRFITADLPLRGEFNDAPKESSTRECDPGRTAAGSLVCAHPLSAASPETADRDSIPVVSSVTRRASPTATTRIEFDECWRGGVLCPTSCSRSSRRRGNVGPDAAGDWRSPPSGIAPQYRGTVPGLTTVSPTHKQPAHRRIPRSSAEPDELLPLVSAA